MDVPELIPARMLNEFADNLETIEGRFGHRRVDKPSTKEVPEPGGNAAEGSRDETAPSEAPRPDDVPTVHSRSVMLSAPGEGLIAKMELVDLSAGVAVPIDHEQGTTLGKSGGQLLGNQRMYSPPGK